MNAFASRKIGGLALLVGALSLLAVASLVFFFIGLIQNIRSLAFMGAVNDVLNALVGFLSAVLASVLVQPLRRVLPRWSLIVLICAWAGALAINYGTWLIQSGNADVELSSYYFFFGNGLIGIWLFALNRVAGQQAVLPRPIARLGVIASLFMLLGLLGLYGILLGMDGSDYSPLIMIAGISFLGTGILYPIWCIRLGFAMLKQEKPVVTAGQTSRLQE